MYWALFLVFACAAFLCGEAYGRKRERDLEHRRFERIRKLYVGGLREW